MAKYIDSRVNIYEKDIGSEVDIPNGMSTPSISIFHEPVEIFLDGTIQVTEKNACILIPAYAKRYYRHHNGIYAESWIHFEVDDDFIKKIGIPVNKIFYVDNAEYIVSMIVSVAEEYRSGQIFSKELVSIGIERLLYEVSRMNIRKSSRTRINEKNIDKITCMRNDMFNNLEHSWTVDEIADTIHFSKSYTKKLYKSCFGKPIIQDLIHARIRRSKILLLNNSLSVEQVAIQSGFNSVSYFISQFKRHTGMTPKEYVKKIHP